MARELPPWLFPISRTIAAASLRTVVRATGNFVGVPTPILAATQRALAFIEPRRAGESFPFLSDGWIAGAREIRESYRGRDMIPPPAVKVNYIVTDAPFGDGGTLLAHSDSTSGEVEFDRGHLDDPDVTVTLPYEAARALIVDADANAAAMHLASGRIKVEGDISKLLALSTANVDAVALEVAERIRRLTA